MYYPVLSLELDAMLQNSWYKFCNRILQFFRQKRKIKNGINISSEFIMFTYNYHMLRNCFFIIHYHLTKGSARINNCITFEPNELSCTPSTLWYESA